MTENEAKTKWCPMVRFGTASCNSDPQTQRNNYEGYCCIASECMWWVWDRTPEQYKNHLIEGGSDMPWAKPSGHCGAINRVDRHIRELDDFERDL